MVDRIFGLATGLTVLGLVCVSSGHTSELDALLAVESTATGLSVLDEPKVGQPARGFTGLCREELELGAVGHRMGAQATTFSLRSRFCNHAVFIFSLSFVLHQPLPHGQRLVNSFAEITARNTKLLKIFNIRRKWCHSSRAGIPIV